MRESGERPIDFVDYITLNQPMSPEEAAKKLAEFHEASPEGVLKAFMNLRGFTEGTVQFREGINNGRACIVMEGKNKEGKWAWDHLIDKRTGQPQSRTS